MVCLMGEQKKNEVKSSPWPTTEQMEAFCADTPENRALHRKVLADNDQIEALPYGNYNPKAKAIRAGKA